MQSMDGLAEEDFIGEGDYDNYKAKMHLRQFIHVRGPHAAPHQLPIRPPLRQIRVAEPRVE